MGWGAAADRVSGICFLFGKRQQKQSVFLNFRNTDYARAMSEFISMQARGTVSIPAELRRRYGLDEPGAQVEVIDADGEIILRPKAAVDAAQSWFWDKRWQAGEIEAEAQRVRGDGTVHESGEEFLEALDSDG